MLFSSFVIIFFYIFLLPFPHSSFVRVCPFLLIIFGHLQPLLCKNAYGNGYKDIVFNGVPSAVNLALDGLTYISSQSNVDDQCSVTVYDGAGGDCLPLEALQERRDGSHSSDDSGDVSVYTLDGRGRAQCYASTSNFTVSLRVAPLFWLRALGVALRSPSYIHVHE